MRIHDYVILYRATAPTAPDSTSVVLYTKSDGRIYFQDDTGVEKKLPPIHVGTTAPASPSTGDLWVDTN